jgi:hypothetical protein
MYPLPQQQATDSPARVHLCHGGNPLQNAEQRFADFRYHFFQPTGSHP